jgi:hypothetical protein
LCKMTVAVPKTGPAPGQRNRKMPSFDFLQVY